MVANSNRIVCTIRLFAGHISTIVYISIFPAFDDDVISIRTFFPQHGKVQSKTCLNSSNVHLNEKKCLWKCLVLFS